MWFRVAVGALALLLLLLQIQLWISDDGFREVARLGEQIGQQREANDRLTQRNQRLEAEVDELRGGGAAVEERARADLGLVAPNETFYIFTESGTADDGGD